MAIQYAGGTVRNDLYLTPATYADVLDNFKTTMTAAGWTLLTNVKAFCHLTKTVADFNNGDSVTIDGKVYTARTTINNAVDGEFTRGVSINDSMSNLHNAINLGAGAGTAYSSATTLHSTIESVDLSGGELTLQAKTGGPTGNDIQTTTTAGNLARQNTGRTEFGGYKLRSAKTPQQLQMVAYLFYDGNSTPGDIFIRGVFYNEEQETSTHDGPTTSTTENSNDLTYGATFAPAGVDHRIIANKYQVFFTVNNTGVGSHNQVMFGIPWLPDFQKPHAISNAVGTPIAITTTDSHGYSTGNLVTIRGVGGNTAANVTSNAITVTGANSFTLDGTVSGGAYTSGGRVAKDDVEILNAVWMLQTSGASTTCFRSTLHGRAANAGRAVLNTSRMTGTAAGTGNIQLCVPTGASTSDAANPLFWFNHTAPVVTEPLIGWGTSNAATFFLIGQLWDAAVALKQYTRDITGTFDSHTWWNYTDANTAAVEGSLLLVVP